MAGAQFPPGLWAIVDKLRHGIFPLESVQLAEENTVRTTVSDVCRVGFRDSDDAQKLREAGRTYTNRNLGIDAGTGNDSS
jgi:hypothetical protein